MLTRDTTHKFARSALALGVLLLVFTGATRAQDDPEPGNDTDSTLDDVPGETSDEAAGDIKNAPPGPTRTAGGVIELESRVTGNKEQPQVFYVVPWQSPDSPRPDYDPLGSQLQDVFGHLEREELKRELDQRAQSTTDNAKKAEADPE